DFTARACENLQRGLESLFHGGIHAFQKRPHHSDFQSFDISVEPSCVTRVLLMHTRRVAWIVAGDRVQTQSDVSYGARKQPHVILTPRAAKRAVSADDAERRFEAGDSTIRCRPAHR